VQNKTGAEPLAQSIWAQWPREKVQNFEILVSGSGFGAL